MKLKENRFTKRDGTTDVTYEVKKLNEYSEGISVDTPIDFKLKAPPEIRTINYNDKQTGAPKTFESVKILAEPGVSFENVQLHPQYNSARFQLPGKLSELVKGAKKEDVLTVSLQSFEDREGNKRSAWNVLINGINPKFEDTQQQGQQSAPKIPKPEDTVPGVESGIPAELKGWVDVLLQNKQQFLDVFVNDDIRNGRAKPVVFITWAKDPRQSDTDWFTNKTDEEITKVYYALLAQADEVI